MIATRNFLKRVVNLEEKDLQHMIKAKKYFDLFKTNAFVAYTMLLTTSYARKFLKHVFNLEKEDLQNMIQNKKDFVLLQTDAFFAHNMLSIKNEIGEEEEKRDFPQSKELNEKDVEIYSSDDDGDTDTNENSKRKRDVFKIIKKYKGKQNLPQPYRDIVKDIDTCCTKIWRSAFPGGPICYHPIPLNRATLFVVDDDGEEKLRCSHELTAGYQRDFDAFRYNKNRVDNTTRRRARKRKKEISLLKSK